MPSMYETIMELPLFKGIGEAQLSQMLEKTTVEFLKFNDNEEIHALGDKVKSVDFILSGNVECEYNLSNYNIRLLESIAPGGMLGALHLFGMNTAYQARCIARGNVSILRIEKAQYVKILQSDEIYLLNFVNYLSAAAQKVPAFFMEPRNIHIGILPDILLSVFSTRMTESLTLIGSKEALTRLCGCDAGTFDTMEKELLEKGIIEKLPQGWLIKN